MGGTLLVYTESWSLVHIFLDVCGYCKMSESSSPNSADNKQISPEKEKENVQKQSTGKEGKKDIAEGREVLVNPFGGGMRRSLCLKRKREVTIETEEPVGEQSDTHEKEDKTSEDSVVSPGETDFERTLREYDEHCQRADLSPEVWDMKMTFDEFCCQEKIDEEEFGPDENLHTIRRECLDLGLPMKYTDREFRMRANRFKEVQRRKRRKEEEVKTASEPDYASNEQSKTESK